MVEKRIKARVEVHSEKGLIFTKTWYNVMIRKGDNQPKMYSARGVQYEPYGDGFMLTIDEGISGSSMGVTSRGTVSGRVYNRKPKSYYADDVEIIEGNKHRVLAKGADGKLILREE